MIDLHCHILPGIDDGPKAMEESLVMARAAVKEGITHMSATPHYMNHKWKNEKKTIVQSVNDLQRELEDRNIPLSVFPGQEVQLYKNLLEDIEQDAIQFLDEENHYILIEFPPEGIVREERQLFFQLQVKGYTPVIAFPERNKLIQKKPNRLKRLVEKGALVQLTAGSYTGAYGRRIQKLSSQLIEADLVHMIASNAHDSTYNMKKAYRLLAKEFGQERVEAFQETSKQVLNGEPIITPTPQSVEKKSVFGLF